MLQSLGCGIEQNIDNQLKTRPISNISSFSLYLMIPQCQKRPQSLRLFFMMTSVTASNTNWTLFVSVAHVKCVQISFVSLRLLRFSNWSWMQAAASSNVFAPENSKMCTLQYCTENVYSCIICVSNNTQRQYTHEVKRAIEINHSFTFLILTNNREACQLYLDSVFGLVLVSSSVLIHRFISRYSIHVNCQSVVSTDQQVCLNDYKDLVFTTSSDNLFLV